MAVAEVDVAGELVETAGVDSEAEDEADGDQHQHDERADAARLARAAAHLPRTPALALFLLRSSPPAARGDEGGEPQPGRTRKGEALLPYWLGFARHGNWGAVGVVRSGRPCPAALAGEL